MPTPTEIRKQITSQIVAALEQNLLPWRKPWTTSTNSGRPANVLSKKPYSGINPLLLELHAQKHGFASRHWGTFRQWQEIGGAVTKRPDHVQPGHWGAQIVFYKPMPRTVVNRDTGETEEKDSFLLRTYAVFNADQVVGKSVEQFKATMPVDQGNVVPDFAPAEELIQATGAHIVYGGDQAFYRRDDDSIHMPHQHHFNPPGAYYETILHEYGHWSETRVGWDYRQHGYAMGELVAEIAASFLATELGVPQGETLENHAAYLKSWLQAMKGDSSFIFKASTQASKTTDFLLSFVRQPEPAIASGV